MQVIDLLVDGEFMSVNLPSPEEEVLPNIKWGSAYQLFTPAYWVIQIFYREPKIRNHKLDASLLEEIIACLLGGHGIKAEVGIPSQTKRVNLTLKTGQSHLTIL